MASTKASLCFLLLAWANTVQIAASMEEGVTVTSSCTTNCTGLEDGNYQSCYSCEEYVKCTGGTLAIKKCLPTNVFDVNACSGLGSSTCIYMGTHYTNDRYKCWETANQCKKAVAVLASTWMNCHEWCRCKSYPDGGECSEVTSGACSSDAPHQCACTPPYTELSAPSHCDPFGGFGR